MNKIAIMVTSLVLLAGCASTHKIAEFQPDKNYKLFATCSSGPCGITLLSKGVVSIGSMRHSLFSSDKNFHAEVFAISESGHIEKTKVLKGSDGKKELNEMVNHVIALHDKALAKIDKKMVRISRKNSSAVILPLPGRITESTFAFGSINVPDYEWVDENHVYVALQRSGLTGLYFYSIEKNGNSSLKTIFEDTYDYKNAVGQILSILVVGTGGADREASHEINISNFENYKLITVGVNHSVVETKGDYDRKMIASGSKFLALDYKGNVIGDLGSGLKGDNINFAKYKKFGSVLHQAYVGYVLNPLTGLRSPVPNWNYAKAIGEHGEFYYKVGNQYYVLPGKYIR